jgi:F0F1-type ATP synthase assembly protein I
MSKTAHSPSTPAAPQKPTATSPPQKPQKLSVGRELLDTTWRMTIPVVLFAGLGIFVDKSIGSQPWVTLLGTIIGFVFAVLLVKKQIERGEDPQEPQE